MHLLLASLLFGLGFIGCNKDSNIGMTSNNTLIADTGTKRYLALGDSYTIGQSVAATDRFPAQTVAQLRSKGIRMHDPEYIATTGWTTSNLLNALHTQNPQGPYDAVSLLIGVNDQYQTHDTTNYRSRFTQLLTQAIVLAGNRTARVFVVSIPDYSATPFVATSNKAQVSKELDWFNNINKQVALQYHIVYIDITPSSREAATNTALIASDSLHPSGLEYKKWADLLSAKMMEVLK